MFTNAQTKRTRYSAIVSLLCFLSACSTNQLPSPTLTPTPLAMGVKLEQGNNSQGEKNTIGQG